MSDLRERLLDALAGPWGIPADQGRDSIQRIWPIIEAELQKRDQEIRRLKSRFGPAPRLEGS